MIIRNTTIVKFIPLLMLLTLSSCISHQQYRTNYNVCTSTNPLEDCQKHSLQQYQDPDQPNEDYLLGFVEFDDQGQLWDPDQMDRLLEQLAQEASSQDVLVVVFAHGWKHSAAAGDGNITSFRDTLRRLSAMEAELHTDLGKKPRKIAGVYLGWRGGSISMPVLKELTFWDRKSTAHKVGYGGVTEVLSRLDLFKKAKREMVQADGSDSRTRLVLIGHSFGGAVVYSAVSEILENNFVQTTGPATIEGNSVGFADLVVLINPAFEAIRYSSLRDMSTRRGTYFESQLPVLAVLTSEADDATKKAFPAGRYLSTFFEKERTVLRENPVIGGKEQISQGKANVTALGHFNPYKTHYLKATKIIPDNEIIEFDLAKELNTFFNVSNSWEEDHPGSVIDFGDSILTRTDNSAGRNPYLNIRVDKELIKNHNDIEDERVEGFIRHLILISSQHENLEDRRDLRTSRLQK